MEAHMPLSVASSVNSPSSRHVMRAASLTRPRAPANISAATRDTPARVSRGRAPLPSLRFCLVPAPSPATSFTFDTSSSNVSRNALRSSSSWAVKSWSATLKGRLHNAFRCRAFNAPSVSGKANNFLQTLTHSTRIALSSSLFSPMHLNEPPWPSRDRFFFLGGAPDSSGAAAWGATCSHHSNRRISRRLPSLSSPWKPAVRNCWPEPSADASCSAPSAAPSSAVGGAEPLSFSAMSGSGRRTRCARVDQNLKLQAFRSPSPCGSGPSGSPGTTTSSPSQALPTPHASQNDRIEHVGPCASEALGVKWAMLNMEHTTARITASGARPCSVNCSSCAAHALAFMILKPSAAPFDASPSPALPFFTLEADRPWMRAAQRVRTPAGDSGAKRTWCHWRCKAFDNAPKPVCC
mmetsp:Transcript_85020/g.259662  ORF Transcript_85020/g.259662 Transcript_85020/m.259662 type:complete len:408 (-) Transcript_85020:216-1439(-)